MSPRQPIFYRRRENNFYRIFLYLFIIIIGAGIVIGVNRGAITPVGAPVPTATRVAQSYADEGDTHFVTGDLAAAIESYRKALQEDPKNGMLWATLARIQTYNSLLKTADEDRRTALTDAMASAEQARALAPDDSMVAAIRAFVLDWNANRTISGDKADGYLVEAEQEAVRALNLDNTNILALAYYAEILIDQQRLTQAEQNITRAMQSGQELMDVYRVYAYYLETQGQYTQAIDAYIKASNISPNLTFLYTRIGANYRTMAFKSTDKAESEQFYDKSLEYFARAANVNAQLGVKDPGPYLSIAKTYSQLGEFYAAGRNVQKALEFDPSNPDVYGQLGIVFTRSRNFEGAIPALKCALEGCTAEQSCEARGGCGDNEVGVAVKGLELSASSVVYYYSYISNLAALSRPSDNKCPEARRMIALVRASEYGNDPLVSSILQENENICNLVGKKNVPSLLTGTPSGPDTTEMTLTPTLTETPGP